MIRGGYLGATARLLALPISRRLVTLVTFGSQAEREYLVMSSVDGLGPNTYVAQVSQIFSRRTFIHVGRAAQEARQPADAAASASLCLTSEARRQDGKAGVPHSVVWLQVDVALTSLSKRSETLACRALAVHDSLARWRLHLSASLWLLFKDGIRNTAQSPGW